MLLSVQYGIYIGMKTKANTSKEPHIGIFWYYKKRLIVYSLPATEVPAVCGFKDIDLGHYEYWDTVRAAHPALHDMEYDEVPRGRVLFDVAKGCFKVYSSLKLIEAAVFRNLVVKTFNLPATKTVFESDFHYEDPGRIDREE